jgi:uncharacterized membrane protein
MNLFLSLKLYFSTFFIFLGIDAIWLTKVAPTFYKNNIGHLMADKPNLLPAALFYILNIFGILVFSVIPALNNNSPKTAVLLGALYGLVTYATYDLTNYATLRGWPLKVVLVDIIWGIVLSASVSLISYFLGTKLS